METILHQQDSAAAHAKIILNVFLGYKPRVLMPSYFILPSLASISSLLIKAFFKHWKGWTDKESKNVAFIKPRLFNNNNY